MATYKVLDLKCPGCGEPASTNMDQCKYCGREVIISSFSSVYEMSAQQVNKYMSSYLKVLKENPHDPVIHFSIAMCYLKIKLYDKALISFERAIEEDFDHSDAYFYAAVCLLKGKKAFLTPLTEIKRAEDYINAAIMIENRAIYYYFLAYIKYDFYERKYLNTSPTYQESLMMAKENHLTHADIQILFELLGVTRPLELLIGINYTPQ